VKRATSNGGPYTQIAAPTATSYNNTALTNGTTYYYVVTAVNSVGESANSAQVIAVPNSCIAAGNCALGTWQNVTPSSINLVDDLTCGNYGVKTVQVDKNRPQDMYTLFFCQGVWKSTDYGQTWNGPINTGTNGATVGDCAGGITVAPGTGAIPVLYMSCIRGAGLGFWKSDNGGKDWVSIKVAPAGSYQQFYPPEVDPYDPKHLLMVGHAINLLVESIDGGLTWTTVTLDAGMNENGGTGGIVFVNTGQSATTRTTWLYLAATSPPDVGTWRTTNGGVTWTHVDKNEHTIGSTQVYQPDTFGVIYMAGVYSDLGWGVLRSENYGVTWTHVGATQQQTVVFGTNKHIYSLQGGGGPGQVIALNFEMADQPGTGTWTSPSVPAALVNGPAQVAVTNDGSNYIFVSANYAAGIWRYVEP